jgi:hypothetical protein
MSAGYYKMHRGWMDHPVLQGEPYSRRDAWVWLIEEACWRPRRFDINGKTVELQRGQLTASTRYLAEAWGWPQTNVRRFLARLQADAMIGSDSGSGQFVITICNYEKYQDAADEIGSPSGPAAERTRREPGSLSGSASGSPNDDDEVAVTQCVLGVAQQTNGSASGPVSGSEPAHERLKTEEGKEGKKESSVSEDTDAGASLRRIDPKRIAFDLGGDLLRHTAVPLKEKSARALIGKWLNQLSGSSEQMVALIAAARASPKEDPVAYITKSIQLVKERSAASQSNGNETHRQRPAPKVMQEGSPEWHQWRRDAGLEGRYETGGASAAKGG